MSSINQNRYDQLIRRVNDLQGPGSKVNDVLSELFPMINVEDPPGELLRLGGTILGFGGSNILGAAGQTAKSQVFNPAGSGLIGTVTSIWISTSTLQNIRISRGLVPLAAGVGTQLRRDFRDPVTVPPTLALFQESSVPLVGGTAFIRVDSANGIELNDPNGLFVLAPGSGIEVGAELPATRILVTFFWRERVAEASELNL